MTNIDVPSRNGEGELVKVSAHLEKVIAEVSELLHFSESKCASIMQFDKCAEKNPEPVPPVVDFVSSLHLRLIELEKCVSRLRVINAHLDKLV